MPKSERKPRHKDALDSFATAPLDRVLQLVLWKLRHKNPEMAVLITEGDITGFEQSMSYQGVVPAILIERPQGRPAHAGARGKVVSVAPFSGEPPRPFVIVAVVERGKKNAIRAIENNQDDFERGDLARRIALARGKAATLAQQVRNAAASGDFTSGTLEDAAEALEVLAKA
jgi:hypothetical protein